VKTLRALLLGFVLATALTACGGDDGDDGGDGSETTEQSTTTTLTEEEEQAAVEAVVKEYFSVLGQGDVDQAVLLLEDGENWRDEMVACSTLTGGVTADVQSVDLADGSNATASIAIVGPDGNVLLPEAGAAAIKVDGEWLVASSTFESLYDLAKDSCTGTTTTTAG
jgi:hypothetical protein